MFHNYFKTALRSLGRNRRYTVINIAGLAVGIAVCVVIYIILQFHTSFDNFHSKKDRIYRVITGYYDADAAGIQYGRNVPFPLPARLRTAFPQLEQVAPVYASHNDELQVLDTEGAPLKSFKEQNGVFYTVPSFFEIFDFPLLSGSYASLKDPNNVLLTKETADAYFGDWKTALGRTIRLTGSYRIGAGLFQFPPILLKVSGVLATIPPNTDFQLKLVVAYGTDFTGDKIYGFQNPDWPGTAPDFGCYILLPPDISVNSFNQQLSAYSRELGPANKKNTHIAQPLGAVHHDTQTGNYSNNTVSHELLNVLRLISAFILLIACVNFVNLSSAQAVNRAKEVGVRKVLGSSKFQLQIQFIAETSIIVITAVMIAAAFTSLVIPFVGRLLELPLSFNLLNNPAIILFLFSIAIIVTALAGFYPSFVLSRFNPVNALKSKITANAAKGISLRRGLVVFQFAVALALIIGTLIIVEQMNYVMNRPLGFDKNAIVNVPFRPDSTGGKLTDYLRHQLLSINGVQAVSFSSNTPVEDSDDMTSSFRFNGAIKETDIRAVVKFADNEYVPTYKLPLVAGRNLQQSDRVAEFLVNESLVKGLGLKDPEDILNKDLSMWDDRLKGPVVGVFITLFDRREITVHSFHLLLVNGR